MKLSYRGVHYDYTPPQIDLDGVTSNRVHTSPTHLNYRGVSYTQATVADVVSPDADLTYRGVSYHVGSGRARTVAPVAQAAPVAIVPANSEIPVETVAIAPAQPALVAPTAVVPASADVVPVSATVNPATVNPTDRARLLMMSHHRAVKLRQQAMLVRLATTLGVPTEEASHYWSSVQGKVRPSSWATYDRSHTAAS